MPQPIHPGVVAIVDDDVYVLLALQRLLRAHGFQVEAFDSAEQCLAQSDPAAIACAVIDMELGDALSGLELGKALWSAHATPVVFMSGKPHRAGMTERLANAGGIAFLEKPFLVEDLIAAIGTHARPAD